MALFGKKKEEKAEDTQVVAETEAQKAPAQPAVNNAKPTDRNLESVLVRPHITEKAVAQSGNNVYTFEVRMDATKHDVRDAVAKVFGVTPVKVNIVKKAPRTVASRMRRHSVHKKGMKKAYVYLKAGDSISLV